MLQKMTSSAAYHENHNCNVCDGLLQGFTYVAPSVLEDMYKSQIVKARSPRKFGSMPRTPFGLMVQNQTVAHNLNQLDPHSSNLGQLNMGLNYSVQQQPIHSSNYSDEMMEVSTGLPHV